MTPPDRAPRVGRVDPGPEPASSSGRWREIQRVVDGALDLPPAERAAYVAEISGPDVGLREHATRLLDACERAAGSGGLLAGSASASSGTAGWRPSTWPATSGTSARSR